VECAFTHSGALQVGRRFTGNDVHASYPEDELKTAVNSTLIAAGLLSAPFLLAHGRQDAAKKVEQILASLDTV
jgi:hypothetical protein